MTRKGDYPELRLKRQDENQIGARRNAMVAIRIGFKLLKECRYQQILVMGLVFMGGLLFPAPGFAACQTSPYWGQNGDLWNPATQPLKDYSRVGYHEGDDPIPYG